MAAPTRLLLAALCLSALAPGALASGGGGTEATPTSDLWAPLVGPTKPVVNGSGLLKALANGTYGDIEVCDNFVIKPSDWEQFELPIIVDAPGFTILVRSDSSIFNKMIDWNFAVGLLEVTANTTLAFRGIDSRKPGNRTHGVQQEAIEVKGSPLWPTITGEDGHLVVIERCDVQMDTVKCNPDVVQVEVGRIQKQANSTEAIIYMGGTTNHYTYLPFPAPLFDTLTRQQVGRAKYALSNTNSTCYDSSYQPSSSSSGLAAWAIAVVAVAAAVAVLAVSGAALMWWRSQRHADMLQLPSGAMVCGTSDLEKGGKLGSTDGNLSKDSSLADIHSLSSPQYSGDQGHLCGQPSGELHSHFMRTRFGPIDSVQLGEMLGRGAFGRVYRGRWKGVVVAVKVIDHRVQQGKTHDLSREPLLSMSVSHPNVVITHRMCVVRVIASVAKEAGEEQPSPSVSSGASANDKGRSKGGSGTSGGKLVPALGGEGMVQVVSPHDVLQPGMYETWLVSEFCDRGSLEDLVVRHQLAADHPQRDIWILLSLLDIAQGLDYLHSNTIIHGDLKPANVLLKAARNDRRGFVCKLGDFGLSRMLGQEESHVETQSFGTASYAAPELLSEGKLTKAADIYSLGIIIWELLTAEELYLGMTAMQVILQVSQHKLRPDVPPACPPALGDLMQRCWSHDASRRPNAAEVVGELRTQLMELRLQQPGMPLLPRASPLQQPQQ